MHNEIMDAIRDVADPSLHLITHWGSIPERRMSFSREQNGPPVLDVFVHTRGEGFLIAVSAPGATIDDVPPRDAATGGRLRFDVRPMRVIEMAEALDAVRAASARTAGRHPFPTDMDRLDSMLRAGLAVGRHLTIERIADVLDTHALSEDLAEAMQAKAGPAAAP